MDTKYYVFLVTFCAFLGSSKAECIEGLNCNNGGYCCGAYTCCYSIYMMWWFWLIVVGVFILKVSCITCYVRARRRRAAALYIQAPATVTTAPHRLPTGNTVRSQYGGAYPKAPAQQQAPPPYAGPTTAYSAPGYAVPPYSPPMTGPSQPPPQDQTSDTRVNKDSELLMG